MAPDWRHPATRRHYTQKAVRAVTGRLNIEVRRAGRGRRHTMEGVLAHLRGLGLQPATVVDVGVAHGTPALYDAFPDAHLVLIEPLVPEYADSINAVLAARPGQWIQAAAGPQPGEMTIEVHTAPVLSSSKGVGGQPRTVPVTTVDAAVASAPAGPVVLKVDVEGAELEAIAGAADTLARAELVLLEVALFEFSPGVPVFHEVIGAMAERGWVVHDVYDGGLRPLDGSLGRVDVAFVRRDGRFWSDQRFATPEQLAALTASWGYAE